jgi:copper chaperone CopZ
MKQITLSVPEIRCTACEGAIRDALTSEVGVGEVTVDLAGRSVAVAFDDQLTTEAAVRSRIVRAGFEVVMA